MTMIDAVAADNWREEAQLDSHDRTGSATVILR